MKPRYFFKDVDEMRTILKGLNRYKNVDHYSDKELVVNSFNVQFSTTCDTTNKYDVYIGMDDDKLIFPSLKLIHYFDDDDDDSINEKNKLNIMITREKFDHESEWKKPKFKNKENMEHKITTEKILEIAEKCCEAKKLLEAQFPGVFRKKNIITSIPTSDCGQFYINEYWAGTLFIVENEGVGTEAHKMLKGRHASLYLDHSNGKWYDEDGKEVSGYFYYELNKRVIY